MQLKTKLNLVVAVMIALPFIGIAKVVPAQNDGGQIIFNAGSDDIGNIKKYTTSWRKGSDLIPVLTEVGKGKDRWISFSFKGSKGQAWSRFKVPQLKVQKGTAPAGIKLLIKCEADNFPNIKIQPAFSDGTTITKRIVLKKGIHEYVITGGFRRAKFPADWSKLTWVTIICWKFEKGFPSFQLKKISIVSNNISNNNNKVNLDIIRHKKVSEVSQAQSGFSFQSNTGRWPDSTLGNFVTTDNFQKSTRLKSWITFDDKNLYIKTAAVFPQPPLAKIKKADGPIWTDEALEFFFCATNDNRKQIQFDINTLGTVYDKKVRFDLTADAIINDRLWKMNGYLFNSEYKNGHCISKISFPLKELDIDLGTCNFIGFQMVQNYSENNLKTLVWTPSKKFTNIYNFGVLVFNNSPFGPGTISIKDVCKTITSANTANFQFNCSLTDFKPGKYTVETKIVASDSSVETAKSSITISEKQLQPLSRIFAVTSFKDRDGKYSVYIKINNEENNSKIAAVNFFNTFDIKSRYGEMLLSPQPKFVTWQSGTFSASEADKIVLEETASSRTKRTAEIFAADFFGWAGKRLPITSGKPAGDTPYISLKIDPAIFAGKKAAKFIKQGYRLQIMPGKVIITGGGEPGLYYGCLTFFQILKSPMKLKKNRPVQCADILDWPDLNSRIVQLFHPNPRPEFKDKLEIGKLIEWVESFVASSKLNILGLSLAACIEYKRCPEITGAEFQGYSLSDLRKLAEYCDDRFIDIYPMFNIGGHANWWLLRSHPELRAKGYATDADVTHPNHDKIVYDCFTDVIEVLKPKYFSPFGDEWFHKLKKGEIIPPLAINGTPRAQAWFDWNLGLYNWLKKQEIEMIMYTDMITPFHNGTRYDVYKHGKKLPKDMILALWSFIEPDYYVKHGFKNIWLMPNQFTKAPAIIKKHITGYGISRYNFGTIIGYDRRDATFIRRRTIDLIRSADYAWNILTDNAQLTDDLIASGRLGALAQMFALKQNPDAGEKIIPLDLSKVCNQSLNILAKQIEPKKYGAVTMPLTFKAGVTNLGFVPMNLIDPDKTGIAVLSKNSKPVIIPIDKYCSSLIFLHATYKGDKKIKLKGSHYNWPYGLPAGHYIIQYKDGKEVKVNLRIDQNIGQLNDSDLFKYTNFNRYIHSIKDAKGINKYLYQWEWVNPYPGNEIKSVTLKHEGILDVSLIIAAISARKIKKSILK